MKVGMNAFLTFDATQSMSLPKSYRIGEKRGVAINPRDISVSFGIPHACEENRVYLNGTIRDVCI